MIWSSSTEDRPRVTMSVRDSHGGVRANANLVWSLAKRDLQARFKSTLLGWAWALIVPVAQIAVYSLVFSVIFRASPPPFGNGREGVFAVWLFVGLISWGLISNAIGRGSSSILGARPLLQKVYFPSYVATFAVVVAIAVQSTIEFALVLVVLAFFGNVGWTWLLTPILIVALVIFAACISYGFALANVYYRDVSQAVPVILQFTFFLSAIIYPISLVPETGPLGLPLRTLIELNPVAQFVNAARNLLYDLQLPSLFTVGYLSLWILGSIALCAVVYRKWGQDVSEMT